MPTTPDGIPVRILATSWTWTWSRISITIRRSWTSGQWPWFMMWAEALKEASACGRLDCRRLSWPPTKKPNLPLRGVFNSLFPTIEYVLTCPQPQPPKIEPPLSRYPARASGPDPQLSSPNLLPTLSSFSGSICRNAGVSAPHTRLPCENTGSSVTKFLLAEPLHRSIPHSDHGPAPGEYWDTSHRTQQLPILSTSTCTRTDEDYRMASEAKVGKCKQGAGKADPITGRWVAEIVQVAAGARETRYLVEQ